MELNVNIKYISEETRQVLLGSLLGDGSLRLEKKGINAYFREVHSTRQKDYLLWKKECLKCFDPKVKEGKIFDYRTGKTYSSILLWTKTNIILTKFYKSFYKCNKKYIKNNIADKIGPLALAVWYCDDGSFSYCNKGCKIATYSSYKENKYLSDLIKIKFGIKCTLNADNRGSDSRRYHLYFSVKEAEKLLGLIKDYVPKSMNYKLGNAIRDNFKKIKEENINRRQRDNVRYRKNMENPVKRVWIRKQKLENLRKRLEDPEFRRKYNEYHKIKGRGYREKKKQSSTN